MKNAAPPPTSEARPDPSLLDDLLSRDAHRRFVESHDDADLKTT